MQKQNTEKNKNESKYFRTAAKMDEALLALLEKKDFEYITVKEICESAGVNRSTFYLHYENTQELLEEATRRVIDKFLTYFSEHDKISFEEKALSELVFVRREYIIPYLNYIKENRRVFMAALNNLGVMGFEVYYKRMFRYIFDPILERFGVDGSAVALCAGVMLMLTSVPLFAMAVICGFYDVGNDFHEILMITIALYAFSKITFAAVNLAKSRKRSIPWESALRSVSLADALVSIASLQRSMLVSFGEMEQNDIRLFNIITGSGVGICIFFIGFLLFRGTRKKIKAKI